MRLRRIVPAVIAAAVAALTLTAAPAAASTSAPPGTSPSAAPAVRGGDVLYGEGGGACTVGYNARNTNTYFGIMAGHCAGTSQTWYADPGHTVKVGVTAGVSFPGDDYALVRYTNPDLSYPGEINLGGGRTLDITGAANPVTGQSVCQASQVTGVHCGTVQAVNVTVNYPWGTVNGLFRTNLCSGPREGGAPVFSGSTALGVGSAASGNCQSGGTTFHQPVVEVLAAYGLSIY